MRRRLRFGSAMVEGALIMTVVVFFICGIVDFARLVFSYNSLAFAVHQSARYAAVHGSSSKNPADTAKIDSIIKATMFGTPSATLSTVVTWTPNKDPGAKVTVQATCTFTPLVALFTLIANPITLKSTATLTMVN